MSLYNKIIDLQKLNAAWLHVKRNHPSCGADNVSYEEFEENKREELYRLHIELKNYQYELLPVKEIAIYKGEKTRNIALFCMRDKIVQQSLADELSKIYDQQFCDNTYAYRPGRSALSAVNMIEEAVKTYNWVLKLDIEKFFDNIDKKFLILLLKQDIKETDVIELIDCILNAKLLDRKSGELSAKQKGIFQGSAVAPILSNIYLMRFDKIMKEKSAFYVRYSDDILILGNEKDELESIGKTAESMLSKLCLQIQKEKTILKKVENGFSYLGYFFDKNGKNISEKAEESLAERLETMWLTAANLSIQEKLKKGSEILGGWEQYYKEERKPKTILEYAAMLYMARNKAIKDKIINMRFQYENIYQDLTEYFVMLWEEWKIPEYQRKEYEQFYQIYYEDIDISIDLAGPLHKELLENYKKLGIHKDKEVFDNLIQIYSDMACYNKAAALQEQKNQFLSLNSGSIVLSHPKNNNAEIPNDYQYSTEDIHLYMSSFVGREDIYAREILANGRHHQFQNTFEPLTEEVVKQHLEGKFTAAVYVQRPNATVCFFVVDIDISKKILLQYSKGSVEFEQYLKKASVIAEKTGKVFGELGLQTYIEFSGYRGYHLWLFFDEWIPVRYVNMISDFLAAEITKLKILEDNGDIQIEFFPNKTHIHADKPGQCIKLPCGIHTTTGDRSYFVDKSMLPVSDIGKYIRNITKYSLKTIKKVIGSSMNNEVQAQTEEKNIDVFVKNDFSEFGNLDDSVKIVLERCNLMRYLCQKAKKTGYLGHFERLSVLYVFGHLGDEGKNFIHTIMQLTLNYQFQITEKFIRRLPEKPVSCIKLREQYKTITAEYGCSCNFKRSKSCYPSPVLHAIKDTEGELSNITVPLSRTLTKEKEKQVYDELNIHKKVQDMSARIVDLKKQKRGIDKAIEKIEKELERMFDNEKVDCMEIEMGILVRRKKEDGYEWLIEL